MWRWALHVKTNGLGKYLGFGCGCGMILSPLTANEIDRSWLSSTRGIYLSPLVITKTITDNLTWNFSSISKTLHWRRCQSPIVLLSTMSFLVKDFDWNKAESGIQGRCHNQTNSTKETQNSKHLQLTPLLILISYVILRCRYINDEWWNHDVHIFVNLLNGAN